VADDFFESNAWQTKGLW